MTLGFPSPSRLRRGAALALLAASAQLALAQAAPEPGAVALKARYQELQGALAQNQFQSPLHLSSTENGDALRGEVHAVVAHPFDEVRSALQARENWCDILILHLNVKQCQPSAQGGINVAVGKKHDQALSDAYHVAFSHHVTSKSDTFLQVKLDAPQGPVGTRDYRIVLEAIPLDAEHSFVHLAYSYGYGMTARLAMQTYLSTLGSGKVGFSMESAGPGKPPAPVKGVRGVIERNTMRYYLAIAAYLDARAAPPEQQLEKRLRGWFAATERHPLQLHEIDEAQYLEMKRKEVRRQQQRS